MLQNKILFVHACTKGYSLWDRREYILSRPQFDKYYDKEFLEKTIDKKNYYEEDLLYSEGNIGGEFISQNISTPSKVIHEYLTIDILKREIEDFKPTHVGFSVTMFGYELFKECSHFIRSNYPNIKIIAGDVGALAPGTENYADHVCKGEGTRFIRMIFGEDPDKEIKIPCTKMKRFRPNPLDRNKQVQSYFGVLTTNLGCGMGCDFCVTHALYGGNYFIGEPESIKQAMLDMAKNISGNSKDYDISLVLTDPLAFQNEAKWLKVIELMKGESYFFHINALTSSRLLKKYGQKDRLLDKFQRSEEIELSLVELGVETVDPLYRKNIKTDWKQLLTDIHDRGIISTLSMIVGFDFHDKASAINDVNTVISYDPMVLIVANLRIQYETQLWYDYQKQNRLLDVPPEFRYLWGYQAFKHPHFEPRFKDCLPLMLEIRDEQNKLGRVYQRAINVIKRRKQSPYNQRLLNIGKMLQKLKT
ncbi:MAG: radical SAM protein [Candidatus Lokiarchaeota archaeon]|nr:radical SAM protein [Candidatus Lokiarchaeota archaeon]